MGLVDWVKQTGFGKWLIHQEQTGPLGPLVGRIRNSLRDAEYWVISHRPANRAHDRRQQAVLAAFEARSTTAPKTQAGRPPQ